MSIELALRYDMAPVNAQPTYRNNRDASDDELVSRVRVADDAAFEELVRRYRNDVFRLSYYYLKSREEAWDISQETFIKAYRGIGQFRGGSSFKTWLLRIAANSCKDYFKKRRLRTISLDDESSQELPSAQPDPPTNIAARELGEAIQSAVDDLSDKHRTAFVLREHQQLSYEEMSEVMRCSVGTVMSRLHHARKNLQKRLIEMGVTGEGHHG